MVSIDCSKVSYHIDDKVILQNITLKTKTRRLGIIGRNGSGKTSLARLLVGLIAPTDGAIRIKDIDITHHRRAALSLVGIVFQNPDHQILFPSVIEEISFGLRQSGMTKSEAEAKSEAMLARFHLSHWRDASVEALSGGQKHLLCLMAVLVMQPQVLVLDEPFVGLDIPTKMQLMDYCAALPITLVQITHQCEDVAEYDEVLWLDGGQVRMHGAPAQVLPAYRETMIAEGLGHDLVDLSG